MGSADHAKEELPSHGDLVQEPRAHAPRRSGRLSISRPVSACFFPVKAFSFYVSGHQARWAGLCMSSATCPRTRGVTSAPCAVRAGGRAGGNAGNQRRAQRDACQAPADELWLPDAHWAAMDAACVPGRCWLRNATSQLSLPLTGAYTLALEAPASGLPQLRE